MTAIYYISSIIAVMVGIGSIAFVRLKWSKSPVRKGLKYSDLAGVDIYKLFGSVKTSFADKKSAILIKLAQKGIVRIREDESGTYYIDKLKSAEEEGELADSLLSKVFEDNVSYVGEEDAIMTYESVCWDDAKQRYDDGVSDIMKKSALANKTPNIRGRIINIRKDSFWADLGIFLTWITGLIPIAIAFSYDDDTPVWIALIAVYATVGVGIIIANASLSAGRATGKQCDKISEVYSNSAPILSLILLAGGWIVRIICGFIAFLCGFFAYTMFLALEWTGPWININAFLGLFVIAITIIFMIMKKLRRSSEQYNPENGYLSHEVLVRSMLDKKYVAGLIVDKKKYDAIMPYAYMLDKTEELEKLKIANKDEKPDWYEGDNWISLEKLMRDLDS